MCLINLLLQQIYIIFPNLGLFLNIYQKILRSFFPPYLVCRLVVKIRQGSKQISLGCSCQQGEDRSMLIKMLFYFPFLRLVGFLQMKCEEFWQKERSCAKKVKEEKIVNSNGSWSGAAWKITCCHGCTKHRKENIKRQVFGKE